MNSISPQIQTQYNNLLANKRKSFGYARTTLARALDKGTFVRGLRNWTLPVLGAVSLGWIGHEALEAPKGQKAKRALQIGLGTLGTFLGAWYGFTKVLTPDPHTAGAIGKLALEHFQVLLKKVDREALNKLASKTGDILDESLEHLNLGHLFDDVKNLKKTTLEDVIEELEDPEEVLKVLDHLGLKLGKFEETLTKTMEHAKTFEDGLPENQLQEFRIELLRHVFDEHNVPFTDDLASKLKLTLDQRTRYGNAKELRQLFEDKLDKFKDWANDIRLDKLSTHTNKKGKLDPKDFVNTRLQHATNLLNTIIPGPGKISSKEMMGEIWDLTQMGFLPVAGGVAGGTLGDALVGEDWTNTVKNKTKEGLFQFLANIMLCNVGAMAFLGGTELAAKKIPGKVGQFFGEYSTRFGAMVAGIVTVGVVGGSMLANFIGENFLNPLIENGPKGMAQHLRERTKDDGFKGLFKNLYEHRHPEVMDVMLHIDDFATGAAISGLSFVEPFLALLYAFSGIRASIGYRNDGMQYTSEQLKQAKGHLSLFNTPLKSVSQGQKTADTQALETISGDTINTGNGLTNPQQMQQRFVHFSA